MTDNKLQRLIEVVDELSAVESADGELYLQVNYVNIEDSILVGTTSDLEEVTLSFNDLIQGEYKLYRQVEVKL